MTATNGSSNGFGFGSTVASTNGASSLKQAAGISASRSGSRAVARVNLPGTRLYDDAAIDREEFVRLVIQSLRDVGYAYARFLFLDNMCLIALPC